MRLLLRRSSGRYHVPGPALAAGAFLLGLGILAAALPGGDGGPVICPFRALAGFPCPTCGMMRATHHALRGEFVSAWMINPFDTLVLTVAAPILLIAAALHYLCGVSFRVSLSRRERLASLFVLAVGMVANWTYVLGSEGCVSTG